MRPLKLVMQAFGPYAEVETIDFTELGNRTMFVISGKTGAGKTSIFDGISFAIYGESSGKDRHGTDLRSHFADDELQTEVSLEFSLRGKIYCIWRAPQQVKRKTRGDGYTTVNAKAELYLLDESGSRKLLTANVRDTEEKIKELIQLDANQFRQILMIPQGDFRKLLISDSKEKEMILQRLFHTEHYKKIEVRLREKARELEKEIESEAARRSQYLQSIHTNGNGELEAAIAEESPSDAAALPLLRQVTKEMGEAVNRLSAEIKKQQKVRDDAKQKLHEAESLLGDFKELENHKRKKEDLDKKSHAIKQKEEDVRRAEKASKLANQEKICKRLKLELDNAAKRQEELIGNLSAAKKELAEAQKVLEQEEKNIGKRDGLLAEKTNLEKHKEAILSFDGKKAELQELEEQLKDNQKFLDQKKVEVQALEEEMLSKQEQLKALRILKDQYAEAEEESRLLERSLDSLIQLKAAMKDEEAARKQAVLKEKEVSSLNVKVQEAKASFSRLEEQRRKDQAAILAEKLVDGSPCPVCGSCEHPAPAHPEVGSTISDELLQEAQENVRLLEEQQTSCDKKWHGAKIKLELYERNVAERLEIAQQHIPDFEIGQAESILKEKLAEKAELGERLQELKQKVIQIPEMEKEIELLFTKQRESKQKLEELAEKERSVSDSYSRAQADLDALIGHLPEGVQTKEDFEKRLNGLQREIEQLENRLKQARDRHETVSRKMERTQGLLDNEKALAESKEAELKKERQRFLEQLSQEGFETYRQYDESKRDEAWIHMAEKEIKQYGEEYRSVTDLLAVYEKRLGDKEKPDLEKLRKECEVQQTLLNDLNDQCSGLKLKIHQNEEIYRDVERINNQIKQAEKQYEIIGHLSNITKGQNVHKITFERYVLASFLDNILAAANQRLSRMTSGRYQLLRKKDRSKGNVQSGLELLVFDQYTGLERHVKTLSGGESFKAALSLALGLADIVQEYAGGVSLETMFIDEGFGTLDPESLDQAIEALMDIQSTGRLVGIISHVPELKERIDARLEVLAGQSGSSTEFVFLS